MQLNEIRVDPLTKGEGDTVSNRPDQGPNMAMADTHGTSPQTKELSLWFDRIMKEVKDTKTKQPSGPMIPTVPENLKNKNKECYEPSVVSIGPYYFKDRQNKFREGEKLKFQMARQFILESGKDIGTLYSEFANVAQDAKTFYQESSIRSFDDEQFTRMMFLDGCFVLQFIHGLTCNDLEMSDQYILVKQDLLLLENQLPFPVLESLMSLRYKKDGQDHVTKIITDFLFFQTLQQSDERRPLAGGVLLWLYRGCLLLVLIYTLTICIFYIYAGSKVYRGGEANRERSRIFIPVAVVFFVGLVASGLIIGFKMIVSFMWSRLFGKKRQAAKFQLEPNQKPAHILELLYSMVVRSQKAKHKQFLESCCCYFLRCLRKLFPKSKSHKSKSRSRGHNLSYSAKDLVKVGIHFKPNKTNSLMDVEFDSSPFWARLSLPSIVIETSTRSMLLNLVAYETTAFLDQQWVTSYICFMDSLIDDADDVKVLRSKGILTSYLGPDQQVADLFNQIGSSLELNTNAYNEVKRRINISCAGVWKKWIAECQQTYFRSPWAFAAVVAAAFGLVLTAIQTAYTVYPKEDDCCIKLIEAFKNSTAGAFKNSTATSNSN